MLNNWNSTNEGINVTVPVANDSTLSGGSIQLIAKINNENYENLGNLYTIQTTDISTNKVLSVSESNFESLSNNIQDGEVTISAIIKDKAGSKMVVIVQQLFHRSNTAYYDD